MHQNTTKTSALRRSPALSRLWALVLMIGILLSGCTSARQREDPINLAGSLRFRSEETIRYFHDVYRSGNLYLDFRPVMLVDAIYEDQQFRQIYLNMLKKNFLLGGEEMWELEASQRNDYSGKMEFLLLVYGGSNKKLKLHKPGSVWKIFLRDDDGTLLSPSEIQPIKETEPVYLFVQKYFAGLDRWSELMRVSFPKLDKRIFKKPLGPHPIQIVVTGVPGSVTMEWEDTGLFYATPADNPGDAATSGKEAKL